VHPVKGTRRRPSERLPSCRAFRSRVAALCDRLNLELRLRPRFFELPAPVHHDLFACAPSKGRDDSFVIRSGSRDSIPRGFDTALQESRRASTEMRATDFCHAHVRYEHPRSSSGYRRIEACASCVPSLARRLSGVWRVSRRPTRFGDSKHRARRRRVNPAKNAASDSPLTLPSPRRIRPSSLATESASGSAKFPCIACLVKSIATRRDQERLSSINPTRLRLAFACRDRDARAFAFALFHGEHAHVRDELDSRGVLEPVVRPRRLCALG
jgi:hypothetical protein